MGNHTVDCDVCGNDLRGLMGGHADDCPGEDASMAAKIDYWVKRGYTESLKAHGYDSNGILLVPMKPATRTSKMTTNTKTNVDPIGKYYAAFPELNCRMCVVPSAVDLSVRAYKRMSLFSDDPVNSELIVTGSGQYAIVMQPDTEPTISIDALFSDSVKIYRGQWIYGGTSEKLNVTGTVPMSDEIKESLNTFICGVIDSAVRNTLVYISKDIYTPDRALIDYMSSNEKKS